MTWQRASRVKMESGSPLPRILGSSTWPSNWLTGARRTREHLHAQRETIEHPEFALAAGMTALRGIAKGWGYDITGVDVLDAYAAVIVAVDVAGTDETVVKADVRAIIEASRGRGEFVGRVLEWQLKE